MEIIPLSIALKGEDSERPRGFIGKYQALKYRLKEDDLVNDEDVYEKLITANIKLLGELVDGIRNRPNTISKVRNCFVKSFVDSSSFKESNSKSQLLRSIGPFDITQLIMLILGYAFKDQIKNATSASRSLERLIEDNLNNLDSKVKSIWEVSKNRK